MRKGDKYLIVFLIAFSLVSLFYTKEMAFNSKEKYISIQVNGEEIKQVIFDRKIIGKTIPIETKYGYNLIEIGDGKVRVIEADCPDKLDVKQGYISKAGEIIVCLPNRLTIEIKGLEDEKEIDHISR